MANGPHRTTAASPAAAAMDLDGEPRPGRFAGTEHLLGDAYHLMAHDDITGKPRGSAIGTSVGVAAALVCEYSEKGLLAAGGTAALTRYGAHILASARPEDAALPGMQLLGLASLGLPAEELLEQLARGQQAQRWVRDRLLQDGYLTERKAALRHRTVYVPTDANKAWWPGMLLVRRLASHEPLDPGAAALAGIALVTGLLGRLAHTSDKAVAAQAQRERQRLPAGLAAIVTAAEVAIGTAAHAHH